MSEKIKVGNAKVEKANYDLFSFMYEKMDKKYVVADLVSKCEDYDKLYTSYELKEIELEEIRKQLIGQDKYIEKLKEEYANQLQQKENKEKELREYIESFKKIYEGHYPYIDTRHLDLNKLLEILDKENKE